VPRLYLAAAIAVLTLTGCHSAYVTTTVSNHTAEKISLVEVDYPSASFGIQSLAPGADLHYRFKVLGQGPLKLLYTDAHGTDHTTKGPYLREGAEGPLAIVIDSAGVHWQTTLCSTPPAE
jgi:hypothetical protein